MNALSGMCGPSISFAVHTQQHSTQHAYSHNASVHLAINELSHSSTHACTCTHSNTALNKHTHTILLYILRWMNQAVALRDACTCTHSNTALNTHTHTLLLYISRWMIQAVALCNACTCTHSNTALNTHTHTMLLYILQWTNQAIALHMHAHARTCTHPTPGSCAQPYDYVCVIIKMNHCTNTILFCRAWSRHHSGRLQELGSQPTGHEHPSGFRGHSFFWCELRGCSDAQAGLEDVFWGAGHAARCVCFDWLWLIMQEFRVIVFLVWAAWLPWCPSWAGRRSLRSRPCCSVCVLDWLWLIMQEFRVIVFLVWAAWLLWCPSWAGRRSLRSRPCCSVCVLW